MLQYLIRRDSKAVMQRPAKPFRAVRLRLAPPNSRVSRLSSSFLDSRTAHGQVGISHPEFAIALFPTPKHAIRAVKQVVAYLLAQNAPIWNSRLPWCTIIIESGANYAFACSRI